MEKEIKTKFSTLFIDPVAMRRIKYYAEAATGEVSGLGVIRIDDKGRHIVSDVHLLEQESSGADTELKPEAISILMTDMMKKNEDPGMLKFWWHSHANMGVFWSSTDDACAETLSHEYAFSLVVNKAGEKKCRLDLYHPIRITIDGIKIEELKSEDAELKEACEKEVKEKVRSPGYRYAGKAWNDDEYGGYGSEWEYGRGYFHGYKGKGFSNKSRVTIDKDTIECIKLLLDQVSFNNNSEGILDPDTWKEFFHEQLKVMVEERLTKKASCHAPLTFSETFEECTGKCKVKKDCAYWTKYFEESEEDAKNLIDDSEVIESKDGADATIQIGE